jgi:hypothetical protein
MINYNIYIDNELAISVSIETDDKTEEYILAWNQFLNILPFTPQVIEYTSFGYSPNLYDLWDGTSFISKDGSDLPDISNNTGNLRYFALVLEGIVKWIYVLQDDLSQEGLIAALLSEPTFSLE